MLARDRIASMLEGHVTPEKLVFNNTIEGMFVRGLDGHMSPRARQRLREAGINVDQPLLPAYPFETWMAGLRIAAEELFPSRPLDEAMHRLGEMLVEGYRQTVLGTAVLSMLRVLGPRRTLVRSAQNFRSGNNYTETRLTEVGATHYELWMNEVGPYPSFTAGIIAAGMRTAGAGDPRVEALGHDGHACTYRITWNGKAPAPPF